MEKQTIPEFDAPAGDGSEGAFRRNKEANSPQNESQAQRNILELLKSMIDPKHDPENILHQLDESEEQEGAPESED